MFIPHLLHEELYVLVTLTSPTLFTSNILPMNNQVPSVRHNYLLKPKLEACSTSSCIQSSILLLPHTSQVNVGCVPKKVMFNAAVHREEIQDMRDYGIDVQGTGNFNWG